jgi:hypothetical protein
MQTRANWCKLKSAANGGENGHNNEWDTRMDLSSNGWMIVSGATLVLLAILMMWRSSRHDLKGAVIDSAWAVARGKRTSANPTEIEQRLSDIANEPTHTRKARRAVRTVIAHFVAQAMGVLSLILFAVGSCLIAAGVFWV